MNVTLQLHLQGDDRFINLAALAPAAAKVAMARAVTTVGRQLKAQMASQQAAAHGFPVRPLSKVRTKNKPGGDGLRAVWFGYNPIASIYVGGKGGGVAGAFLATMPSGHTGLFHRLGRARLPIAEVKAPLPAAVSVAEGLANRFGGQAQTVIADELSRVLLGGGR